MREVAVLSLNLADSTNTYFQWLDHWSVSISQVYLMDISGPEMPTAGARWIFHLRNSIIGNILLMEFIAMFQPYPHAGPQTLTTLNINGQLTGPVRILFTAVVANNCPFSDFLVLD
jgi:hypothetical protein